MVKEPIDWKNIYSDDFKYLKQIQIKLENNDAIFTKADDGNTIVIIGKQDYSQKAHDFFNINNIFLNAYWFHEKIR